MIVEAQRPAIEAWCARKGWSLDLDLEGLAVTLTFAHPTDTKDTPKLKLLGDVHDFRAVPPAWKFVDPETGAVSPRSFPQAGPGQSIFHPKLVLCAPWNRLAYASEGGPHGDWVGTSNWLQVQGHTRATTIPDMLAAIHVHLQTSPGRRA